LSQKILADLIQYGTSTISNYEKGKEVPKEPTVRLIAHYLNKAVFELNP
jgi:transcriptional regulator with XRE-family HTH domain